MKSRSDVSRGESEEAARECGALGNRRSIHLSYGAERQTPTQTAKTDQLLHKDCTTETNGDGPSYSEAATAETARPYRRKPAKKASGIYFVRRSDDLVKIGTSHDIAYRLKTLAKKFGRLDVLGTMPGDRLLEREVHAVFDAERVEGEWFRESPDLTGLLVTLATGTVEEVLDLVESVALSRDVATRKREADLRQADVRAGAERWAELVRGARAGDPACIRSVAWRRQLWRARLATAERSAAVLRHLLGTSEFRASSPEVSP